VTLRNRLTLLVGVVVAITVALVTWTVSAGARRAFETMDAQRTAALIAQFRHEVANEGDEVVRRVDRIAAADALRRTAAELRPSSSDRAAYVNEAAPLAEAQGLDFLDIVASDGTIVSSAHWPARFGYKHPWATAEPPSGDQAGAFLQAVELPRETALGLMSVRTVTAGDRRISVAGGRRLDQQFLQSLVLPAGMRALLYRNVEPEVSRLQLIDASGNVAQAGPLEPLIARVRQSGTEAQETVVWPDGPETIDAMPLTGRDGTVLGVLLVGSSGRELAALIGRIRWTGVVLGGLGILFGVAASYAVAARVTRPVEQLAGAARAIAGGNWTVPVGVKASGEIEALALAFDTMTRQLVDQRERLVQAERVAAWRELARRLAHELKNPLFPLRITIDNLRRARALPAEEFDEVFTESMTTLATGLANLNAVIGRFSDFARMPAPELEQVSPNEIVQRTVRLFQAQLQTPGRPAIAVVLDLDPALGTIRADPEQLGRVCQNLLLNAIDAMPAGGDVTIRTRRSDGVVRLEIADTGEGLTDEERKRLFTPYYTTKQHGTGLGLAIVQSVVADHAGKIWVESEPGRGTTFYIELPASPPAAMPLSGVFSAEHQP
jgi:signal transduction histidine kinase